MNGSFSLPKSNGSNEVNVSNWNWCTKMSHRCRCHLFLCQRNTTFSSQRYPHRRYGRRYRRRFAITGLFSLHHYTYNTTTDCCNVTIYNNKHRRCCCRHCHHHTIHHDRNPAHPLDDSRESIPNSLSYPVATGLKSLYTLCHNAAFHELERDMVVGTSLLNGHIFYRTVGVFPLYVMEKVCFRT